MYPNSRMEQLTETIKRNSDSVYRLAFSMVKTVQDAEDIRQEVFIRYIHKNPAFESPEHERAWFIRVTTNLCKNLWKSAWRQKTVSMDATFAQESDCKKSPDATRIEGSAKDISGDTAGFLSQMVLTDEEERVVETVKRLPVKYRAVVHLFYYEEMSVEEIAGALKLQPSNVRARLTRARKMLADWLKEDV